MMIFTHNTFQHFIIMIVTIIVVIIIIGERRGVCVEDGIWVLTGQVYVLQDNWAHDSI